MQVIGRPIENHIRRFRRHDMPGRFELRVECDGEAFHEVTAAWQPYGPAVSRTVQRGLANVVATIVLRAREDTDVSALEEKVLAIKGVHRIDVRHLGIEEET